MKVRLTHIDGRLPNLALMKLSHWHQTNGDTVLLTRHPQPTLFESSYDYVYASAIFQWSLPVVRRHLMAYPDSIVGGTGSEAWLTVEDLIGEDYEHYDYSIYPDFPYSIGFTQRGCRLKCGFCVVPKKEGKPRSTNSIYDIWREGMERSIVLLDNDFFGQPENEWRDRIQEIRTGGFKVNFNQGINIRMITEESASAIASIQYSDVHFQQKRIYTAWDNLKEESVFLNGLKLLTDAGVSASHVMVYMLVGYNPKETMEDIMYRYRVLHDAGCKPYPMVYNNANPELKRFQRWVVRRYHEFVPWEKYRASFNQH